MTDTANAPEMRKLRMERDMTDSTNAIAGDTTEGEVS